MSKLPAVTPKQVVRALKWKGFYIRRQSGSHVILYSQVPRLRRVTIPWHHKDLKKGTLRRIIKDVGLSIEEFVNLLKK